METFIAWFTLSHVASTVTIIVGLAALSPRIRNWFKIGWSKTFGSTKVLLREHIIEEESALARIEAELHPNGGKSIRDVLNRIEAHQSESDAFLRATLNIHDVAVVRTDARGKLINANRAYLHLLGVSLDEVRGDGWVNIIHPEYRDDVVKKWRSAVEGGREFSEDILFSPVKGEPFKAHANVFREVDKNGNIQGYLGVITPVSTPCPFRTECLRGVPPEDILKNCNFKID